MSEGGGIRAIDHVGITVPSIDEASAFLVRALGAEVLYDMTIELSDDTADQDAHDHHAMLGSRPGARWKASRMLRLGEGPSIELFEYVTDNRRDVATPSDYGLQHFAVYVDDIEMARQRLLEAGAHALAGPNDLPDMEAGQGNRWQYMIAPWGTTIELITYPSPQRYQLETGTIRWRPPVR